MILLDIQDSESTFDLLDLIATFKEQMKRLIEINQSINEVMADYPETHLEIEPLREMYDCMEDIEGYISHCLFLHVACREDKENRIMETLENFFYFVLAVDVEKEGGLLMACL